MKHRLLFLLVPVLFGTCFAPAQGWDPVPSVDLSKLKASDFRDDELDIPYYLKRFQELAGAVVEDGPNRGFMNIRVWRAAKDNQPYNARIMESILSLTWFYTTNRPWNPYYGSKAVRQRLEAALDYWRRLQSPEGKFSEYGPRQWNLAATAFATKFMGRTLMLLKTGPPIDAALHKRVIEANRRAIRITLTDPEFHRHGLSYTNQFTNVFAGGLAFLALYPDRELEAMLRKEIESDARNRQSPAGYFYEADGADFGYNLGTHHTNLDMAWHYTRGTDLGKVFAAEEQRWFEWFTWNAVPEPDWRLWTINRGVETRQKHASTPAKDSPLGEAAPSALPFARSGAEVLAAKAKARREMDSAWPDPQWLDSGGYFSGFSPYAFLLRDYREWHPTTAERDEGRRKLPYLVRKEFAMQIMDSRKPAVFTYVRRPGYYAAFNSGELFREQQRYGLGLMWSEKRGAVLQSQTGSDTAAWGTKPAGGARVYEAASVLARFTINGSVVDLRGGVRELPTGALVARYALGQAGEKTIEFGPDAIRVTVKHPGQFTEFVPLLRPAGDALIIEAGEAVSRGRHDAGSIEDGRQILVVELKAAGSLTYRLRIP